MGTSSWRNAVQLRRHSQAKYVRLKIRSHGVVEVVVPLHFNDIELPAILDKHAIWVEERLQELDADCVVRPPSRLDLSAIDEQWQMHYQPARGTRNGFNEDASLSLSVYADESEKQRELLKRWLSAKAKKHLIPWLEQTSEELQLPFDGVSIRGQRTRWGSCSSKGRINLNYALLFLEADLVRYLFVHELCHTVHHNHSSAYWKLVESIEPHYKIMEKALKRASKQMPAWIHTPFTT